MVLAFRSPSEQLLQGLSCDQRVQLASAPLFARCAAAHSTCLSRRKQQKLRGASWRVCFARPRGDPPHGSQMLR